MASVNIRQQISLPVGHTSRRNQLPAGKRSGSASLFTPSQSPGSTTGASPGHSALSSEVASCNEIPRGDL
ncbi:hypothetical protein GQ44DRAFT_697732, partial [Phaeosphaeriaceae sp. PMI808]